MKISIICSLGLAALISGCGPTNLDQENVLSEQGKEFAQDPTLSLSLVTPVTPPKIMCIKAPCGEAAEPAKPAKPAPRMCIKAPCEDPSNSNLIDDAEENFELSLACKKGQICQAPTKPLVVPAPGIAPAFPLTIKPNVPKIMCIKAPCGETEAPNDN